MYKLITVSLIVFLSSLISCCHQDDNNYLRNLFENDIVIPIEQMIMVDTKSNDNGDICRYNYFIICYLDSMLCSDCTLSKLNIYENIKNKNRDYNNTKYIYIISNPNDLFSKIHNYKTSEFIYLDTCNAFLSANPQIPDNELYHTFVINKEGKVLMVGNPFQSEKMEELFKKVIAKERKKQKKNANKAV